MPVQLYNCVNIQNEFKNTATALITEGTCEVLMEEKPFCYIKARQARNC